MTFTDKLKRLLPPSGRSEPPSVLTSTGAGGTGTVDVLTIKTQLDVNVNRWDDKKKRYKGWYLHDRTHNLKTNTAVTFFAQQCYGGNASGATAPVTTGVNFMGLSTDATAPGVTDTTMAGEATTNGLGRAQATTTIGTASGGSVTVTITYTWTDTTATTSNVQKGAVFTAVSAGTMGHEYTFTSTTLAVNDQIQTTLTITVS